MHARTRGEEDASDTDAGFRIRRKCKDGGKYHTYVSRYAIHWGRGKNKEKIKAHPHTQYRIPFFSIFVSCMQCHRKDGIWCHSSYSKIAVHWNVQIMFTKKGKAAPCSSSTRLSTDTLKEKKKPNEKPRVKQTEMKVLGTLPSSLPLPPYNPATVLMFGGACRGMHNSRSRAALFAWNGGNRRLCGRTTRMKQTTRLRTKKRQDPLQTGSINSSCDNFSASNASTTSSA